MRKEIPLDPPFKGEERKGEMGSWIVAGYLLERFSMVKRQNKGRNENHHADVETPCMASLRHCINFLCKIFRLHALGFCILFVSVVPAFSQQNEVDHWETVIYDYEEWRYLVGTYEPDSDWRTLSFDDLSWSLGPGGIGYGDDDDRTDISQEPGFEKPLSLYLRKKFTIYDTSVILLTVLNIDFDDAFVAYINNVEVARVGVGAVGDHPAYNQPAYELHEATMYQGQDPEYFMISKEMMNDCLVEGENILAIQVHNYNNTSSDMSSITFLSVGLSDGSSYYSPVPGWFNPPEVFTSSNLPIVVINTHGLPIVNEPRVFVDMGIIDNGPGQRNNIMDLYNGYNGKINIELRGSSTLGFPKKSYLFETQDSFGLNNNVSLLGMPAENDWILYAPYSDKSLIRNVVTYDLGNRMGSWAPRCRFCELIVNGDYRGVYVLMEKIKRDDNRLDIATLLETDISGNELTGGYIIRIDKTDQPDIVGWTSYPNPAPTYPDYTPLFFQYYYPKPEDLRPQQAAYIQAFVLQLESTLSSTWFTDPLNGYRKYIDAGSLIDHFIMRELSKEIDSYRFSTFMYKEKDSDGGRLYLGPIWDFNLGYGNVNYGDAERAWATDGWIYDKWSRIYWWKRMFEDPLVINRLKCRWEELRQGPFHADSVTALIDSLVVSLQEGQVRNFNKWNILGTYVWPNYFIGDTWEEEITFFTNWITARLAWMDANMLGNCNPTGVDGIYNLAEIDVYPNPFDREVRFSINTPKSGRIRVRIYNVLGEEVKVLSHTSDPAGQTEIIWNPAEDPGGILPAGIYLYTIELNDHTIGSGKVVKQ